MRRPSRSLAVLTASIIGVSLAACLSAAQQPAARTSFDGQRAFEHTRQLVSFGPRPSGSAEIIKARGYIKDQLTRLGLMVREQAFEADTPAGRIAMANVRATIGDVGSGKRLILAGHYDTKRFSEFAFVGANDGGSSAAFLLEIARVLKAAPPPVAVELLFLDGEEAIRRDWIDPDNRYGSRYYVEAARRDGTLPSIGALVLVDMIGDRDLRIKREARSTGWLTDLIWMAAARKRQPEFVPERTPIEDDHIPFLEAGVPAVDLIDLEYPAWHTAGDTLDKVDARSLQIVGEVVLEALPAIAERIAAAR